MPFSGGGSSSSASNTTNVSVEVNPEITNQVIVDDSRLQAMVDTIAKGNELAAAVALTNAQAQAKAADISQSNADKLAETIKTAAVTAVVGFAISALLKRA